MSATRVMTALGAALVLSLAACGERGGAPAGGEPAVELHRRLAALEARAERARDVDAIKRLQRMYGYYLDEGLWDRAADLFAEDGTIEIGLDGVYVGRERVREYLYAMGGGRSELPAGRLNEHLQVMPVVTLAPDGRTARARWREILMVGTYGESAQWGEGPMENEYVKEDGVWKIKSLHWHQSLLVPYEQGWAASEDPTGGVHVSEALPPDRPPSIAYETWPGVYLPPFHFPNPGAASDGSEAGGGAEEVADAEPAPPLDVLAQRAAALTQEVAVLEAENEIENLQRTFGYYFDEALWSEVAALFAEEGTIELGNQGVYVGPERILAFLRTLGEEGPRDGRLYDHMQLQPVIHVAPDAMSAKARWRLFSQTAEHGVSAEWGAGTYENEYVREDGVWKIARLKLYPTIRADYDLGWAAIAKPTPGPSETLPPDRPTSPVIAVYPAAFTTPFHYDHPVFGRPVYFEKPADYAEPLAADAESLAAALDSLEARITRIEDVDAIERLNSAYGYYLAANAWDDFTELFAENGTIEIALRGVYVGKASVRRSMDLYGEPGTRDGLLHNHMQFQPVIHVSEDGRTAKVRSRALSIMGEYEGYAGWMGGVYENTFSKGEDGVWRMLTDRVFNTYFAPYPVGWKDLRQGSPPGVSETNPPDRPPTSPFDMYPKAFLVPFHYPHPVTGREVGARE